MIPSMLDADTVVVLDAFSEVLGILGTYHDTFKATTYNTSNS